MTINLNALVEAAKELRNLSQELRSKTAFNDLVDEGVLGEDDVEDLVQNNPEIADGVSKILKRRSYLQKSASFGKAVTTEQESTRSSNKSNIDDVDAEFLSLDF